MAVITSDTPRYCGEDDFSRAIVEGFAEPHKAHVILNRLEAIAFALDQADEGDTVVLAGMGDRVYPNPAANGLPSDDVDVARLVLSGALAALPTRIAA
jgi:UDP-N-acetylmuramoyl-L-alanyl-D-glutamate--2,6-diaminopimelate ligase